MPNTQLLKQRLSEKGITQTALAQIVGVAVPTICQKLNGTRPFTLEESEIVAKALDIPDGDFGKYFFAL